MRNEAEMLQIIRDYARNNVNIRAVIMNGSRANSEVTRDIFQDYDIVYFVDSVQNFIDDQSWISYFGDILIMQTPDKMDNPHAEHFNRFAFLMLFKDGNRIDLTFFQTDQLDKYVHDSQTVILLDKDGLFGNVPSPSNRDYLPTPPSEIEFYNCCNEFWWVSTYVAKGLWRRQLPYAMRMYEVPVRDMLMQMITWYIGVRTSFKVETGKEGKYFEQYLEVSKWGIFVRTFSDGDYERIWKALFEMGSLFRDLALTVSENFGYDYSIDEDEQVTSYLHKIYNLPTDAKDIT
ncbi:aminoglycoside adenylyltransferase [Paenibacillus selenitireducens]|uniref:Aminoglycoside adenylyltransferase n=1 Tax=Paenibacillus selenitireducens TaxID=1324314 RepID=A0A1T2WYV4_9BACL|nr:aminoglycoside 6-adenylyltransferase [Paenibacillus selenitireducens]OPA72804.1 aminoglycoside adenylyltransferase [Paenibacillus selenitireducens]